MLKKLFSLLFAAFAALLLPACSVTPAPQSETRTVTDDSGRQVSLPMHPKRIVSLTYGTDEILTALVSTDHIASYSKYAGDGGISFLTKDEIAKVGRTVDMEPEHILALAPDLVIASTSTPMQTIEVLTHSGVPVYVSGIPTTVEEMKEKVRGVAKAVHEEEQGEALVSDMDSRLVSLEEKLSQIPPEKERVALGMSFRGILGKKGTLFSDVLRLAHVKDGAAVYEVPKGADAYLSLEILPQINPDVILLPTWRVKAGDDTRAFAEGLLANPALSQVTAVKERRLVPFSEKYKYVMSQHVVDAVEAAARAVYPEVFATGD
ncbi:MAG: ABC transporter substrate-binding protein [Dialister sp.]|nr:ABC transporter substrate-binding protein [Dialister sp.]